MTAETLRSEFASAREDAAALLEGLGDAQFNWRRAPGTWSMAQCLDHLNLTGRKYLRALDRAIDEGRAKNLVGKGPFRYGLLECWAVRAMDAPPMFRMKAPKAFAPASEGRLAESLEAFRALQGFVAAPLIPLSQTLLLASYPPALAGLAMSTWSMTALLGPLRRRLAGKTVGLIVCGTNIAPERFTEHLERGTTLLTGR